MCKESPLRGSCHQAAGNRRIEENHRLNELKSQAKELLMSEKGLRHRSKRATEPKAVFGQLKSNNKFNRFTFMGLEKVEMEFLLMTIGHNFRKMAAKGLSTLKLIFQMPKMPLIFTCNINNGGLEDIIFASTQNSNQKFDQHKIAA
ncbi:transposase [Olivibacter sitiensis]|uniref:transposase n=1 Tax=Olivibacter sitiensis TaxID=376470 RepID=UPI0004826A12|nr:transposase [Olivibacter sitiensis]